MKTSEQMHTEALRDQMWVGLRDLLPMIDHFSDHPENVPDWLLQKVFHATCGEILCRKAETQETPDE